MTELIRDTVFGHLIRWISGGKVLPHPEDLDPRFWKKYVHEGKTARIAQQGHTGEPESDSEPNAEKEHEPHLPRERDLSTESSEASQTRNGAEEGTATNDFGMKIDPEKGKDLNVIHFEPNDSEDPMNWSSFKKVVVTAEICLLTTSVYIGSAIYTPGIEGVTEQFGVSRVAATLGQFFLSINSVLILVCVRVCLLGESTVLFLRFRMKAVHSPASIARNKPHVQLLKPSLSI